MTKIHQSIKNEGAFYIGMVEGEFVGMVERGSMPRVQRYFKFYTDTELVNIISKLGFTKIFQDRYIPSPKTNPHQIYKRTQ